MKLDEILDTTPIRTAMYITTDNISKITDSAYKGIPAHLREFTTPRTEVASYIMKDPSPENMQKILDEINAEVSKAFLRASESAKRKYGL